MITIAYVYKNESFGKEIFEEILMERKHSVSKAVWSHYGKEIQINEIRFLFLSIGQINESYRGLKTTIVYFEPSLSGELTEDQKRLIGYSQCDYGIRKGCKSFREAIQTGEVKNEDTIRFTKFWI